MTRARRRAWAGLGVAALVLLARPAPGQSDSERAAGAEVAPARDDAASPELPFYVAPSGAPRVTDGAGGRGERRADSLGLLAPDHVAHTTHTQPTLYWYLGRPSTTRIVVTVRDRTSVEPLLEVDVPPPAQAGIHALRLADHGVELAPEVDYLWFVSIVRDHGSKNSTVTGGIRRRAPSHDLIERLRVVPEGREVFVYAENGIWYDAIAAVSARISAAPGDRRPREQRAALLDQVGLSDVAAWDRGQATPSTTP